MNFLNKAVLAVLLTVVMVAPAQAVANKEEKKQTSRTTKVVCVVATAALVAGVYAADAYYNVARGHVSNNVNALYSKVADLFKSAPVEESIAEADLFDRAERMATQAFASLKEFGSDLVSTEVTHSAEYV